MGGAMEMECLEWGDAGISSDPATHLQTRLLQCAFFGAFSVGASGCRGGAQWPQAQKTIRWLPPIGCKMPFKTGLCGWPASSQPRLIGKSPAAKRPLRPTMVETTAAAAEVTPLVGPAREGALEGGEWGKHGTKPTTIAH